MNEPEAGGARGSTPPRVMQDGRFDYWRGSWGSSDTTFGNAAPRRTPDRPSHDELGAALLVVLGVALVLIKFWFDLAN